MEELQTQPQTEASKKSNQIAPLQVSNNSTYRINPDSDTILDNMMGILQKDFNDFILQDVQDRARGCLFGAFIGDSIGSRLEFQKKITDKDIKEALNMNGGGKFHLLPAQLTSDSELAIAQAFGILSCFKSDISEVVNQLLKFYFQWMKSNPFNLGQTIKSSWSPLIIEDWERIFQNNQIKEVMNAIKENVKAKSSQSQSNGFLMKQASLGIFLWKQSQEVIFQFAIQDTLLTHCHQFCLDISRIYIYAISQLVKRGNDIYCECRNIIVSDQTFSNEIKDVFKEVEKLFSGIDACHFKQKSKPSQYGREKNPDIPKKDNTGWVKWAFIYSMIALLSDKIVVDDFFSFLLSQKGDTDTNLCIAGAIVGARYGMSVFDKKYIEKVNNCRPETNNMQKRPKIYAPGCYKHLSDLLILKSLERNFSN